MKDWKVTIIYGSWSACGAQNAMTYTVHAASSEQAKIAAKELFDQQVYGSFLYFGLVREFVLSGQ